MLFSVICMIFTASTCYNGLYSTFPSDLVVIHVTHVCNNTLHVEQAV